MKRIVLQINDLNIEKEQYGALNHVSFIAKEGQVLALLGLDYSGPQLVFQLLQGNLLTDWKREQVYFFGEHITEYSQLKEAIYHYKDSNGVMESWTVAEYLFSQRSMLFLFRSTMKRIGQEATVALERFQVELDPMKRMGELSELERRKVELVRGYLRGARLFLFEDEGEGMTDEELREYGLFLRKAVEQGLCVLLVSHFKKVFEVVSTDLLIFQKGRIVKKASHINGRIDFDWKSYFLGSTLSRRKKTLDAYVKDHWENKEVVYEVEQIPFGNEKRNFEFKRGEITSFIILNNKDREEFFLRISGRSAEEGIRYRVDKKELLRKNPKEFIEHKIISISRLKKQHEVIREMSIQDNLMIPSANKLNFIEYAMNSGQIKNSLYQEFAQLLSIEEKDAKNLPPNEMTAMNLERWLIFKPKVFILFDCFVGNDPYGVSIVQSYIKRFANLGVAVILIKSSPEHMEDISDRFIEIGN